MAKKTEKELREKMEDAIDSLHGIATNGEESQLQVSASNGLANMIRTYKETFGVTPENPEKLRSVKNF